MRPFLLCLITLTLTSCANTTKATEACERYATDNFPGWELINCKCEGMDSDGDGRVRCNISVKNPENGDVKTPGIECPASILPQFASDCQTPKR